MATKKRALETQSGFGEIRPLDASQWEVSSFVKPDLTKQDTQEEKKKSAGVLRTVGDMGLKLGQGVVDVGSMAVGAANLASGGLVGKGLRAVGYDPQATNEIIGDYLSDDQKQAEANVAQADGFTDSVVKHIENPRAIFGGIAQSAPAMLNGMAASRAIAQRIGLNAALSTAEGATVHAAEIQAGKSAAQAAAAALGTESGRGAAKAAIEAASTRLIGAGAATEGLQTAGKIADDAQAAGREYSDYALPALGAGAVTAAVGLGSGKLFGDAATQIATGSNAGMKGGIVARGAKGFLTEGLVEEAPQSYSEQVFTNIANGEQDITKGASTAAGAGFIIGGAQGGGMAMVQGRQKVSETGPLTRSLNAGIDVENATLQTSPQNPATQNIDPQNPAPQPSADLPATQNNPAQQFTGMDELISAVQNEDNPSLVREITQRQTQQQMDQPSQIEGMPANFSEVLQQSNQQREQERIETRGTWEDAKEQAAIDLAEQDRLDQENRLRLPAPDMPMPENVLIDDNGTLRPQTYQDAAAAQVAAAQREELGQSVPYGERGGIENVQVPSSDNINSTDVNELPTLILNNQGAPFATKLAAEVHRRQLGKNFSIIAVDGGFAVQNNDPGAKNSVPPAPPSTTIDEVVEPVAEQAAPSYILHPSGKPFTNKIGAQSRLKQLGGNHTIVPYEGGFAIRNNDPQAVTQVKEQQAASGVPDATAGSAQPEPVAIQPGDIMHPSGKPFANKYPAVMTQRQSGGEIIKVDGGYIVRPPKQPSLEEIVAESQSEPTYEKGKTGAETARNKLNAENPFLSFLGKYGLNIEERSDVGGERGKARLIPGHGPLFRKNGLRLDELAQVAKEAGFLSQEQIDSDTDNGGVNALADMIGQALNNEVVPKVQSEPEVNPDVEMLNEAKRVGLDVTGKTPDQVYDMVKAYHDQVSQPVAAEVVSEVPATTNESAQVDVDNGQISMRKTPEEISLELQKLTDTVRDRTKNFDLSFDDGNEINFMTPEEKSYRHKLLSQLPSSGEEQLQAKKRIEEKVAARREAKATDGVQADVDLEWNAAVDLFNELSLEAQELAREYNLHELYFDIEELENAETNDAGSQGDASQPVTGGAIQTEEVNRGDNETSTKQAEGVDAAEAGSQEAIGGETASKPTEPVQKEAANSDNQIADEAPEGLNEGTSLFSRESGRRSKFGFDVDELQPIVDQISSTWKNKPKINIVQTIDDLPFDAPNDARGAYFKKQVYLVAANLRDQAQAEAVLFHETLGHAGLNEFFGKDLAPALRSIAMKNRKIAEAAAVWRKGNTDIKGKMSDERYHLVSIEEALADYVGTGRTINGVEKLLAAIQKGLRAIGLNSVADWMENATDAEVLSMLASARKHVEKGADFSVFGEQQAQAFSRDEKNALSISAEAKGGNRDALFSRSVITGDNNRTRTPEQLRAFKNVGRTVEVPTLKERFNKLTENLGKKLAQGIVDQFAPIKDLSAEAYGLMRLSKGASGAFEAMLKGGQLKLSDGVYDFDEAKRGGVVDRLLVPLQGESDDFMWWVAGNRAEALSAQGKEHLFTTDDIKAFKSLANDDTSFDYVIQHGPRAGQTTRNRKQIYDDSLKTFNEFNKNTLDMAEQSGLIDPESRKIWESEFYIPFYRVSEESDDGVRGMNVKSGVVRQQAFKKLKGGTDKLNSDLLENTLMNWAHLLDASAKNRAAKSTLEAAENVGAAMPAMSGDKKTVWYMDNGEKKYFTVEDVHLLAAIQGLEYAGMRNAAMDGMTKMKHIVTMSITASPFFKTKNLIRDSISAIALADINYNPVTNIKEGWKLTDPKSDDYFRMLAGGGTIHFGSMLEGNESKRIRKLIDSGVDESTILKGWDSVASKFGKVWDAYNELGNRGETINRASLYNQLIKKGVSHAEASLQARDMMDFSMQGSWTIIRALTQVVPFMNARLQGLYKLGKSAKEDPKRFGTVLGAVAMSSIALMLAYADDDDWKKREDWDRDTFWWFKFGGTAFRIPKPFEIGAIGTLAERGIEYFTQDEMTGERFIKRFKTLLLDNLSMNPTPQLFKPIIDIYANKDSFTDRPIESMSMERLQSDYRFNGTTSMPARAISTTGNAISGNHFLSPVQIDHLIRGYFGWLGTAVVGTADRIVRLVDNEPARATIDRAKWLTGGMVSDLSSAQSRYVTQMYEQAKVLDEAYGTWRMLIKTGKVEEAKEFAEDNADKLRRYKGLQNVKKQATSLNEQTRVIERSNLDADEKRDKINLIQQRKDNIARRASL